MPSRRNDRTFFTHRHPRGAWLLIAAGLFSSTGCQDGPMYALKTVNPYFTMKEWKEDEAIGITDHERRKQLTKLAGTIESLPKERQIFWLEHLRAVMTHDPSAEMRRIAVSAAGPVNDELARGVIAMGLKDDSVKVRMEACRALGQRSEEEAAVMLAETVGSETEIDVRHAAMAALANFESQVALDSLRLALADRNPATRHLAMESLRGSTGKNYGDDPQVWIAALEGKDVEPQTPRLAERLRSVF